jgi:uncharacterized cupin superfamily protein
MSGPIINWDECRTHPVQQGPLEAAWTNLGVAAGTVAVGLRRQQIAAGKRALPPHQHSAEEEIFFVLGGSGLSWQNGETFAVREGDCLVHLPGGGAHTLVAGPDGLDVLAFGDRVATEAAFLPRAHVAWLGSTWVAAGEADHPWARDAAAGELALRDPSPRPTGIVNVSDVDAAAVERGDHVLLRRRDLGTPAGSRRVGVQHVSLAPSKMGFPPHCHSAEEELFVVLEGDGVCLTQASGRPGWEPDEHPVRRGSVVSMPAGTGVAHAFRAGLAGLTYLAYGQRLPHDQRWYPRSRKIWFKGLGVVGRLEPLSYWDGEE